MCKFFCSYSKCGKSRCYEIPAHDGKAQCIFLTSWTCIIYTANWSVNYNCALAKMRTSSTLWKIVISKIKTTQWAEVQSWHYQHFEVMYVQTKAWMML